MAQKPCGGVDMPVCMDCKEEVLKDYQIIETKRSTKVCICNECLKKYQRKEVKGARDSK